MDIIGWVLLGAMLAVIVMAGVRAVKRPRDAEPAQPLAAPVATVPSAITAAERSMAEIRANLGVALQSLGDERDRPGSGELQQAIASASELTVQLIRLRDRLYPAGGGAAVGRSSASANARGAETVLMVDDEPSIRSLARRTLERLGYVVLEAGDPVEALRLLERGGDGVDLLVTDIVMPHMSGVELVERMRERWPLLRILYISGAAHPDHVREVERQGLSLLAKPFSPDQLGAAVRHALDALPDERDVMPAAIQALAGPAL